MHKDESETEEESVIDKFKLDKTNVIHRSFDDKSSTYISDILSNRRDEE